MEKGDKAINKITGEIVKIYSYNKEYGSYKVQNKKGHFSQIDESTLFPYQEQMEETNQEVENSTNSETKSVVGKAKNELIANKYLIIVGITLFIILAIGFFTGLKKETPKQQPLPKTRLELLLEENARLELSKSKEFNLQKKSNKITRDSIERVKTIDDKINNNQLEIYQLIK